MIQGAHGQMPNPAVHSSHDSGNERAGGAQQQDDGCQDAADPDVLADQIERARALGIGPSFLINHVHYWGHVMRDQVFGPDKVRLLDRCASVEAAGMPYVVHSDAPVSPLGPLSPP